MDDRKVLDVDFGDFRKAFDIPHGTLLDKLSNCEINRFMLHRLMN